MKNINLNKEQIELCRKLRRETGLHLMVCKKCLEKNNWNYNNAKINYKQFEWNRKLY